VHKRVKTSNVLVFPGLVGRVADCEMQPQDQDSILLDFAALWELRLRGPRVQHQSLTTAPVLYCTVLHCTVLHCTVLYCTVLHCTALSCTALYCTVLYCTVLCCSVLCSIVLCCTCSSRVTQRGCPPVSSLPFTAAPVHPHGVYLPPLLPLSSLA